MAVVHSLNSTKEFQLHYHYCGKLVAGEKCRSKLSSMGFSPQFNCASFILKLVESAISILVWSGEEVSEEFQLLYIW